MLQLCLYRLDPWQPFCRTIENGGQEAQFSFPSDSGRISVRCIRDVRVDTDGGDAAFETASRPRSPVIQRHSMRGMEKDERRHRGPPFFHCDHLRLTWSHLPEFPSSPTCPLPVQIVLRIHGDNKPHQYLYEAVTLLSRTFFDRYVFLTLSGPQAYDNTPSNTRNFAETKVKLTHVPDDWDDDDEEETDSQKIWETA